MRIGVTARAGRAGGPSKSQRGVASPQGSQSLVERPLEVVHVVVAPMMMGYGAGRVLRRGLPDILEPPLHQGQHVPSGSVVPGRPFTARRDIHGRSVGENRPAPFVQVVAVRAAATGGDPGVAGDADGLVQA